MSQPTRTTPGKLGRGPIFLGESESWPLLEVAVAQYYSKSLEVGCDEKAVERYQKLLAKGRCPPVSVSSRYDDRDPLDGSHRLVAAHRLGLRTIKARVEPGTRLWRL